MKNNFFLVLLLVSFAAYSEECLQVGTSTNIPFIELGNGIGYGNESVTDQIILYPQAIMGGLPDEGSSNQEELKYYDRVSNKVVVLKKKASEYPGVLKNGNIALYDMGNLMSHYESVGGRWKIKNDDEYLQAMKKTVMTVVDVKTGKRSTSIGKMQTSRGEIITPEKIEIIQGTKYLIGKNEKEKLNSFVIEPGSNLLGHSDETNRDFIVEGDDLSIFENNKKIYSAKLDEKYPKMENWSFINSNMGVIKKNYHIFNLPVVGFKNKFLSYDPKNKKHQVIEEPVNFSLSTSNPRSSNGDGSKIVLTSVDRTPVTILDMKTGAIKAITKEAIQNPQFFGENKICGVKREDSQSQTVVGGVFGFTTRNGLGAGKKIYYDCFDLDGNKISSKLLSNYPVSVSALSEDEFLLNSSGKGSQSKILKSRVYCPKSISFEDCDCDLKGNGKSELDFLLGVHSKLLCSVNFKPEDWDKSFPNSSDNLSEKQALSWLKRTSKPHSLADSDFNILKTVIENGIHKKYPGEFKSAMLGILAANSNLYEQLVATYPQIASLDSKTDPKEDCLSSDEKTQVTTRVQEFIKDKISKLNTLTDDEVGPILSLGKSYLNHDQKDKLAEDLGDLAVEKMNQDVSLINIFPSKIFKFSYNYYKKELGIDHKDLTDLTVVRDGLGNLNVIQLGVSPSDGTRKTLGGIHLKSIKSLNDKFISGHQIEKISWNYGGKDYNATIDLAKDVTAKDISPASASPDYKAMKSKGPLKGLIIAGSNLGQPLTSDVVQEYLEYYSEQGFDFDEAVEIDNVPAYFKESISGPNKAHYLVKEAHSDGDEKNLFRVSQKGKILRGKKINPDDGTEELVDIVYPGSDYKSTLISNAEFGKWMSDREKEGGPELVYINSSCWSQSKAVYEISAAKTPKLINIPTTTSMVTFTNNNNSVMYAAVDGIRKEKTYAEIREGMRFDPKYVNRSSNVMIFPDEPEYESKIRAYVRTPISIDTKINVTKNGEEVPYSIED